MTLSNDSGGPDIGRMIEKALKHRLEAHRYVNGERIDEILAYARENVKVRMTPRGWEVIEADVQKLFDQIAATRRWQVSTSYEGPPGELPRKESAMERLKRANRDAAGPLRQNPDGSYSPAE